MRLLNQVYWFSSSPFLSIVLASTILLYFCFSSLSTSLAVPSLLVIDSPPSKSSCRRKRLLVELLRPRHKPKIEGREDSNPTSSLAPLSSWLFTDSTAVELSEGCVTPSIVDGLHSSFIAWGATYRNTPFTWEPTVYNYLKDLSTTKALLCFLSFPVHWGLINNIWCTHLRLYFQRNLAKCLEFYFIRFHLIAYVSCLI